MLDDCSDVPDLHLRKGEHNYPVLVNVSILGLGITHQSEKQTPFVESALLYGD